MVENVRLMKRNAPAGGPNPRVFLPIHEYHPASSWDRLDLKNNDVLHPVHPEPEMFTPLYCHIYSSVGGLPIAMQLKIADSPFDTVLF